MSLRSFCGADHLIPSRVCNLIDNGVFEILHGNFHTRVTADQISNANGHGYQCCVNLCAFDAKCHYGHFRCSSSYSIHNSWFNWQRRYLNFYVATFRYTSSFKWYIKRSRIEISWGSVRHFVMMIISFYEAGKPSIATANSGIAAFLLRGGKSPK